MLFASMVREGASVDEAYDTAVMGSACLLGISVALAVFFLAYGVSLYRLLYRKSSLPNGRSMVSICLHPTIGQKMLMSGAVISFLFVLEAAMWLASVLDFPTASDAASEAAYTGVYLTADCLLLLVILAVFRRAVDAQFRGLAKPSESSVKGEEDSGAAHTDEDTDKNAVEMQSVEGNRRRVSCCPLHS
jgi:hypothetical protein